MDCSRVELWLLGGCFRSEDDMYLPEYSMNEWHDYESIGSAFSLSHDKLFLSSTCFERLPSIEKTSHLLSQCTA